MNSQGVAKDSLSPTIEPKKSARLAQKRKLREEAATPVSEDDINFPASSTYSKGTPEFAPIKVSILVQSPSTSPLTCNDKLPNSADVSTTKQSGTPSTLIRPTPNKFSSSLPLHNQTSSISTKPSTSIGPMFPSNVLTSGHPQTELSSGITTTSSSLIISPSSNFTSVPRKVVNYQPIPTSSVESSDEKWLDALELESGKPDDVDDVLQIIRNPTLLTTQQRTLRDINDLSGLLANPSEELEILSLDETEKQHPEKPLLLAAQMGNIDRQHQTLDKSEYSKGHVQKKSFDRLFKRHTSTSVTTKLPSHKRKPFSDTKIVFLRRSGPGGRTITFPPGMDIPFKKSVSPPEPPVFIKCSVEGCANRKKYACSKTNAPLCSLMCYKVNLEKYEEQLSKKNADNIDAVVITSVS